jgi:hypothetical protein
MTGRKEKTEPEDLRCEHGLRRPCEVCDPYQYAEWLRRRTSE